MGASCDAVVAVIELLAEVVTELAQTETTKTQSRPCVNIVSCNTFEKTEGRWERMKKMFFKVRASIKF